MTALASTARDSATMLRRDMLHSVRFPLLTISGLTVPILLLLLFDGVFGNTLHAGLGGGRYIDYLTPGILLMTASSAAQATALNVNMDMTEGIIARFRTMAISRASVLTGQVLGSLLRTLVSGGLMLAVAVGLGFRPHADALEWLGATGVFALLAVAVTWLTVSFGLFAKTPAGANSLSLVVVFLPFVSSAYVTTASMPAGVRWFAEHQPFTPIIQTLRDLLAGTPSAHEAVLAVAWCLLMAAAGYLWARASYERAGAR